MTTLVPKLDMYLTKSGNTTFTKGKEYRLLDKCGKHYVVIDDNKNRHYINFEMIILFEIHNN